MDKDDYCNKIKAMLSDQNVYKKLKRNPTSSIEKKTSSLLKNLVLPSQVMKKLNPRDSSAPRLYGLPKIHKESIPLRPIVSNVGGPTYQLARHLVKPLQTLVGLNNSHIKNSMDFVSRIEKIKSKTNDILVSFDVVSLFTNVPVQDTLDIIKKSQKIPADLFPLIEHCLTSTYFQFQESSMNKPLEWQWDSPSHPLSQISLWNILKMKSWKTHLLNLLHGSDMSMTPLSSGAMEKKRSLNSLRLSIPSTLTSSLRWKWRKIIKFLS